ncbi:non-ribosomal peptide synthase/polyketide synthase [Longimicrobium sp.]|jgi:amino acid adenylation domain-containing protein|uniref:non-ribosomal peptide synthetase n=1 Tax=Longimicrobium sp. TaxID=2029185 RepID=UPI002EDB62B0
MLNPSTAGRVALPQAIAPMQAAAEYWQTTLSDAPGLLELPTDHARSARQDSAGASIEVELDEELSAGLEALSQRHGATLSMTLLAGWAVVLSRLSGQAEVVIGTQAAGRGRGESDGRIGFAANPLPIRADLSGAPTVAELLQRVKERVLGAQHHQDVPFEQVVELVQPARGPSHHPLFQATFVWRNTPAGDGLSLPAAEGGGGLAGDVEGASPESPHVSAKFDLSLVLGESEGRIAGSMTYATALFERATVERWVGYLRRVLEGMVADERGSVERLELLSAAERRRVVEEWNATDAAFADGACVHELFEAQAARAPTAVAVAWEDETLSYGALNERANRLAHHLAGLGVGPEVRVGICLERGTEMVVSVLAVLKAGGAYVPLDPAYPAERLAFVLADAAVPVLVTQESLRAGLPAGDGVAVVSVDGDGARIAAESAENLKSVVSPDHLAYVIYTSGSTGTPKGVMVPHRGVPNLAYAQARRFGIDGTSRVLQFASFSFDAAVSEVFDTLLAGATLVMAPREALIPGAELLETLRRGRVTVTTLPPSVLAILAPDDLPELRTVVSAGEAVDAATVERWSGGRAFVNAYGPTETTVCAASAHCEADGRAPAIGRPLENVRVYVLNAAGGPAPVGVPGELYVGGVGVARGYLGRPGLTAEKFVPDPFSVEGGARLYRTGDRVRWSAGGELEFVGRVDAQIKVRGFRIEPGEIEARLVEHAGVREAVVLVREDAPGEKRLVAYLAGDETAGAEVLRAHLSERLPEYMVPAAYVRLDALPLTPNGKVDRRALPALGGDAFSARGYEAPVGEAEEAVAAIWAELLGVERVGRRDHFFERGGHSLLAARVVSRVRQALGVEAVPRDLFERPVLAEFARGLEAAGRAEAAPIAPVERSGPLPLSFAQRGLWFLEQLGNLGSTYHIPTGLRLRGELDRGALARALDRIVARHEALRTTFVAADGEPVQRITPAEESAFGLVEHDLSALADAEDELRRLAADEAGAPFDLARGPLVRGRLVRMAADDHVLLLTMHHIVSDGWSMGVLHRELGALYAAFARGEPDPLPPLPVQYADYAAWHRRWVEGEVLRRQADYWRGTLAGAPDLLELPADHPRPARQDFAGATLNVELDEALTAALKAQGQRHGTTLYMTLLAGWAAVLARLSGQDEVVIGTPSANRGRAEVEELIGFFVNTLPVRIDLSDGPRVGELLDRVKARALEAQQNQDIPFEQVVELVQPARSLAHSPLFQVMFAWQNAPASPPELPGLSLAPADAAPRVTAMFDLLLSLSEDDGRITGEVEYATALFERETVERWLGYLRRVLEAMAADDGLGIDRLPMLAEAERALVLREFNDTRREYPREACVHELVEPQVKRTPGAVAVMFEGERVTYAELNARANRLAHHLRGLGVGPDARVGICVERSVEMVVGLLGILKAGGAYVPLDSSYPVDRLRYMLEDSAPAVLLTHPPLAATAAALSAGFAIPVLDLTDAAWAAYPETNPEREGVGPGNLAHVLFTSGSTGRPKGVMLEHGSLVNRLAWMQDRYGMEAHEALLQKTPFSFDVSFWEFFWPLMVGARLVMARPGGHRDPAYLAEVIRREGITVAHFVPSMLQLFLEHPDAGRCTGLLRVPVSGEAVSAALVRQFHERLPGVGLYNQYGPTESGEVTEWECAPGAERVSIGRAIHNSTVYVLDRTGEPVPVGVAGELFIGGVAVARGYLGRPRLTAERFVPDPFGEPGARMYRSGDLCRWLPDGTLEYLGRTDFQVKVRGFRVELGEIEARLAEHAGVREAVVLALDDGSGGKRLVGYLVGEALESEALRAHLSAQLPEYMVPAAFVRLDAFPVTPNGKLDRRALPAPDADAFAARAYEEPVGEAEIVLAATWSELLGVERVGRGDDFFALGGHSLLAVRVVSRVRQALGVQAEIGDLFVRPVLADFARGLAAAARAEAPAITPMDRTAPIPLSFAQQRLWVMEQLGDLGSTYHIPMHLRLRGELDRGALVRSLGRIVARHEALRTTFPAVDGEPVQHIAPAGESAFPLVEHDLHALAEAEDELRRLVSDEAGAPFDLARGPLVRGRLVRMAADDHVLLLTMHHIVSDGWSMGVLHRELGALYAAFACGEPDPLPPLRVQYADYAAWHRRWVEGPAVEAQAEYWTQTLAGAPELLELPTDHPRPAKQNFAGATLNVELDEALTAALKALGQRHGATLYMTLLAGWAAVLARLSGQDEVVVGTPTANRLRSEIEGLIGFFINTLPVRVDLSGAPTVAEALGRVKARALEAQQNQDIPFEKVVERVRPARSLAHSPLFQVMLAWQNAPASPLELPRLSLAPADAAPRVTAKFDLLLSLSEEDGRITGEVEYATALFEQATVERWLGYLRRVLEAMAADDGRDIDRLPMLAEAERALVLREWNATEAAYPREACVHELVEAQVARTPGAVAVVFEDQHVTYAELNARANRLAHHLRALGVGPDARVAICVERGPEMVAGLLAILKAGGAYVPLDPAYPAGRLRTMLEDSAPAALVTQSALAGTFAGVDVPVVELDAPSPAWARGSETNPACAGLTPGHLAYVIYTSGSTGRPKGVMVEHRSLVNHTAWQAAAFGIGAGDTVLQRTSVSFDASVWELWTPLATGARMLLLSSAAAKDPGAIGRAVEEGGATVAQFVPTLLQAVLGALPAGGSLPCRVLFCGGEPLSAALVAEARAAGAGEVVNLYGPTEATIDSTSHVCGVDGRAPAIGRPIANARTYVLDARGEPAPAGVAGELYVGGAGVSRGYLGRPGLTAEKFVPDPFSVDGGARMYRTGDLGRWRVDGTLEFLGRTDFQVKVRGFRIEPGEIEAALQGHDAVRDALVLAREDAPGDRRLAAYYLADEPVAVDALKSYLANRLPAYMVPAAYVWMEAYPLTPNGKVDRKALPAPEGDAFSARGYEAPVGEAEEAVAAIWAELLGAERVGRRDHFFERGGHSLLAARVVSRVRQALGVEAVPRDLFERPVLAEFARGLEAAARADAAPIAPVERSGPLPLSFAQRGLWFLEQLGNLGSTYHIPTGLRLRGELDRGALVRALDRIVARHEALRTTFAAVDGEPVQRIAPVEESAFGLVEHDLHALADAEDELRRLVSDEAGAPFDLARGPLVRGRLVRMASDDHVLLLTMHHIVSDGWSMGVLHRELGALYAAFACGEPDPLPPLPVQYADYVAWHRRWVEGEVLRRQADYWRETLAGAPDLLELPADHPRPARQDFAGATLNVELDEALTGALKALGQRHGTTLYMTLLAGWAAVLARLSGQDEVVVGTPSANRGRSEIEGLIGFFVNTLPVRVDLSGAPTVSEALGRVKARALEAQQNQDIPFEQVVELVQPARSLAHSPVFQVMFAWQNAPASPPELPGLSLAPADAAPRVTAMFDLLLSLSEDDGRITGEVEYATALFEREAVERWLGYLRRMLEAMAADDGLGVDRLPMLAEAERDLVLREFNDTRREYPRETCVHELVEAQVKRTPGAVAVVFEDQHVTYAELNARANRLAHHLRAVGVGSGARVGICVERSVEMVVGLLAILKAGGAYVPLDSSYPVDRLRYMLEDSAPAVLLTHPPLAGTAAALSAGFAIPVLDLTDAAWAAYPETNPEREGVGPGSLAHVLFTSGSTGRPKGVMLEHGSLVNRLAWMQDRYAMTPDEVLLQKTPFSFDVSFCEFFWPLMVGARLVMARPDGHRDPAYLIETIRREGITHAHFVPSMLQLFLEHPDAAKCTGLLRVPVSGEAVSAALVRHFHERLPGVELTNQYGPTESGEVTEWACVPGAERVSIGRAIHNSTVYVLDRTGEPVPVGVAGELFIGGVAVARGYLGRPRLTAERFVPDPFGEPGARMYRSGDLCRWLPDGTLEYLGRTDFQVKVRGFRVELGEIEARLAAHPGVREAVVLALDDGSGGKRLVGYLVGEALESEALRAHLSAQLPEYMVPAAFVRLDAFPVTPNGKLDRRALPAPDADAFAARAYEEPVGEAEIVLAATWSELLGVERVGRGDHFFALGGHSLLAVRVVSRVRQVLGVQAEIGDLFVRPVLADFARGLTAAARAEAPAITPVDRTGPIPLSFSQQRLWVMEQLGELGSTYHIASRLRLKGELDRGALARALDGIVARHEVLRTTFAEVDGVPEQRIAPAEANGFTLAEHDLGGAAGAEAELQRVLSEEARAPFDLERGPLIRGCLIRLAADDHLLLVTMHHIVSDGWSMGVLFAELGALYAAHVQGREANLPALPVQYADYAAWEREWIGGELLERQASYWERTLAGAPELLELPTDRARPRKQDFAGGWVNVELHEELAAALKALSRRHGATLFMTLLAGWAAVLARLSGQDDVVIGTPSANRGRREVEELIGFFVNTLPLRVDLSDGPTVGELLQRVKTRALEGQRNQDIPFEQVVERVRPTRSLAHTPLFQVMFAWQNAPGDGLELPGLVLAPADAAPHVTAKFDLLLSLWEEGGRIAGGVEYATSIFERATVERYAGYLRRVLEEMAEDDAKPVGRLELLGEAERARLLAMGEGAAPEFPRATVDALFAQAAAAAPGAVALAWDGGRMTYAELDGRANRLAHHLRRAGVAAGTRVGVFLERGPEMVVATLAALKAGGAYVPLDPAYPAERLAFMLADTAAPVLVTESSLADRLPPHAARIVRVDADAGAIAAEPADAPAAGTNPEAAAYVMYTSGSTGRPKGVEVPHRAIVRLVRGQDYVAIDPSDVFLQLAPASFDAATLELWGPLLNGARLAIHPAGQPSVESIGRALAEHGVTVLWLTAGLFHLVVEEGIEILRGVRQLLAGGDVLSVPHVRRVLEELPGTALINGYGPTENTTFTCCHRIAGAPRDGAGIPVGRPIANTYVRVLDAGMRPAPAGVPGELYAGGAGLALGYLNRPELTAEKFVADPYLPGARLYRTGDRVRWSESGTLEFLGRTDFQVKIRGFRIEPGEIEAALLEHAGVRAPVVLAREDAPGEKRLVAYYLADEPLAVEALKAHLANRLPEHMVPAAYVWMEAYPLTPNGKTDRGALPAPGSDAFAARGYEAPAGETEEALAEIWAELLGVERVGRHDDFFQLGGNSLLATRLVLRIRREMDVELPVSDVFETPALSLLAQQLLDAQLAQFDPDQIEELLALARAADVG